VSGPVPRVLLALLLLLTSVSHGADPEPILVVMSADEPFRVAYQALKEAVRQKRSGVQWHELVLKDAAQRDRALAEVRTRRPPLVLTLGSTATLLVRPEVKAPTPIVFCMVLNPEAAGLVPSPGSGSQLTGGSLDIPVSRQFATLRSFVPKLKRIGVLYDPNQTQKLIDSATKVAADMGLELVPTTVGHSEPLPDVVEKLRKSPIEALWSVADSTVFASNRSLEYLARRMIEAKLPFMGLSAEFVKAGALLALSADYRDVGLQCSDSVLSILQGAAPSSLPITAPRTLVLHVNRNSARVIGLPLPSLALTTVVYGYPTALPGF